MNKEEIRDAEEGRFVHATALVLGEAGIVIRGPSGSGKSSFALLLIAEARRRGLFGRLVGDDRIFLQASDGGLIARCHPAIKGLIECRTQPIARVAFEKRCLVKLFVDLYPSDVPLPRLPAETDPLTDARFGLPVVRLAAPAGELSCHFIFQKLPTV